MRPLEQITCVFLKEENGTITMKVFANAIVATLYYKHHPEEEARIVDHQVVKTVHVPRLDAVVFEDVSPFNDNEWETE